jgi:Kef-type K+ transport system membrane component KefB
MKLDLSFLHTSLLTLIGIAAVAGFYMGHLARRVKLPALIGYMIFGVILGPSVLNIFNEPSIERLSFIAEIGLGFVAVTIGSELRMSSLKRVGRGIVSIIFVQSFMAFFVVASALYLLTSDLALAIIFGAMAPATAPAGTVAVIQESRAKGSLTKALYAVVGFDDGLAVIIFGFAAAISRSLLVGEASGTGSSILPGLWAPILEISASLLLGGIIGYLFCGLVSKLQDARDILIILFGVVLLATGLSICCHLSLILTNMMIGFVLINTRRGALVQRVREPLLQFMPLVFILFFCLAGAHLKIFDIPAMGTVGLVYILGRSAGKIAGARLGSSFGRVEDKIKKYLGLGTLSQAGVAIGLSLIVKNDFAQIAVDYDLPHAAAIGAMVLGTITTTSIFFEIIGPLLTRFALKKANEIPG